MKKNYSILMLIFIYLFAITSSIFSVPPHPDVLEQMRQQDRLDELSFRMAGESERRMVSPSNKAAPTTGNINVCVILMSYDDVLMDAGSTQIFYNERLNGGGATILTAQKYYKDMSNSQLSITFDIYGPFSANYNMAYYGTDVGGFDQHPGELVIEAINAADPTVNFSTYINTDFVIIIHAGKGQEVIGPIDPSNAIWSHQWNLSSRQAYGDGGGPVTTDEGVTINTYMIVPEYVDAAGNSTIGVFTHEFGHILGLPDLYDTSELTDGVGNWSLMAGGAWNGIPDGNNDTWGDVPAPLLAWEKAKLGWITLDTLEAPVASNSANPAADYQYASFTILGIVLLLSLILTFIFGRKKGIRSIFIFFLPVLIVLFIPFSITNCSEGDDDSFSYNYVLSNVPETTVSLIDVDTSFNAKKIPIVQTISYGGQYLIVENKVQKNNTWSEYLPGEGLLITFIDDYILYYIYGFGTYNINAVNAGTLHGVNIIEADGDNALGILGSDQGSTTDPFYDTNNDSYTPYTNPYTYFNNYVSEYSYIKTRAHISIENISVQGNTMTFDISD